MPEWRQHKRDWRAVDAAILRVLCSAHEPLSNAQIHAKARVPRLHFDIRLQSLKRRGLIEIAYGRTIMARWQACQPLTATGGSGSIAVMSMGTPKATHRKTLEGLAAARATVAGLITGKPATHAEVDECLVTFDEIIRAVELLPSLKPEEQRDASRLVATALSEIRGILKRRPR